MRVFSWNLFHGRDFPPEPELFTLRSKLFGATERGRDYVQVNHDLYAQFAGLISSARWDVAMLQECPPRWADRLARQCAAEAERSLTSRNSFGAVRAAIAERRPDLMGSWEGGCNLTLVRRDFAAVVASEEVVLTRRPERRTVAISRLDNGTCVANLHASGPRLQAVPDCLLAAQELARFAAGSPHLLAGDFNESPRSSPALFADLINRFGLGPIADDPDSIDQVMAFGLQTIEPPWLWRERLRDRGDSPHRLRLSDHAPVQASFATPKRGDERKRGIFPRTDSRHN